MGHNFSCSLSVILFSDGQAEIHIPNLFCTVLHIHCWIEFYPIYLSLSLALPLCLSFAHRVSMYIQKYICSNDDGSCLVNLVIRFVSRVRGVFSFISLTSFKSSFSSFHPIPFDTAAHQHKHSQTYTRSHISSYVVMFWFRTADRPANQTKTN